MSSFASVNHYQSNFTVKTYINSNSWYRTGKVAKLLGLYIKYSICKAMRYLGIIWTETKRSISNVYQGAREAGGRGDYTET